MKILKLKSILFSLLAILTLSILLISCDQEVINLGEAGENIAIEQSTNYNGLMLPNDVIEQSETYIIDFLDNASEEDIINYHNNYITFKFLQEVSKSDKVLNANNEVVLENIDLSTILSIDEMNTLNNVLSNSNTITERGCVPIKKWNNCCWRNQWNQCVGCWKTVGWWCG